MKQLLKNHKWFLISLFALAFFIRAAIFVGYLSKNQNFWQVDSNTYHSIATQIANGNGISTDQGQPNFYRLPGYPILLSLVYKILGPDSKNALWFQIILGALIPLLIFLLAGILFPKNILIAKAAGLYSCIHLGLVLYSGFFMAETLFIFLFLIFAILFMSSTHLFFCPQSKCDCKKSDSFFKHICLPEPIATTEPYLLLFEDMFESEQKEIIQCCCQEAERIKIADHLFLAGITLGLATLVRPVGHYLIFVSILILILSNDTWWQKISKSITLCSGWLIPVIFWLARNFVLTGYIFFHTLPGGHFLYFSASRLAMDEYNCSFDQAKEILRTKIDDMVAQEERLNQRKLSEIEQCYIREELAKQYFKKYFKQATKLWITDIFRTSFSLYSAELMHIESGKKSEDYFNKNRTIASMISKYLWPKIDSGWIKFLIRFEIFMFLFILFGLFLGCVRTIFRLLRHRFSNPDKDILCSWIRSLAFVGLFLVIGLAGGYARMRLPAEPFLIILSMSFWADLFN